MGCRLSYRRLLGSITLYILLREVGCLSCQKEEMAEKSWTASFADVTLLSSCYVVFVLCIAFISNTFFQSTGYVLNIQTGLTQRWMANGEMKLMFCLAERSGIKVGTGIANNLPADTGRHVNRRQNIFFMYFILHVF